MGGGSGVDPIQELIQQLFGNGELGAFYLPQPVALGQQVLFQDAAGTIPVTTNGDPVGLVLDLSGNENHLVQSTSSARPLYRTDTARHWIEGDGVDDILSISGSKDSLVFLTDGTGATLQFVFGKDWAPEELHLLAGSSLASVTASGIDLLIDDRGSADLRYRHVNPTDSSGNSSSLNNAVSLTQPTVIEYCQDADGQVWSTSEGVMATSPLVTETPNNDFRIFGTPNSPSETTGSNISPGALSFYGGLIVSEKLEDLTETRQFFADFAGITLP